MLLVSASRKNFKEVTELKSRISVQVPADAPTEREQKKGLEPLHDLSLGPGRPLLHNLFKFFFIYHCLRLLFLGWLSKGAEENNPQLGVLDFTFKLAKDGLPLRCNSFRAYARK